MSVAIEGAIITLHAVRRWQERVDHRATVSEANDAIAQMFARGSRSPRARRWLRDPFHNESSRAREGVPENLHPLYVYLADRPGVALVTQGDTVVTVLTAASSKRRRARMRASGRQRGSAWTAG